MTAPALTVRGLSVHLGAAGRQRTVVNGVDFELATGEVLALVGESGCGKSKTAEAIMGLIPPGTGRVEAETIRLGEQRLYGLSPRAFRRLRGREISMVFQEPRAALDPVFSVGQQLSGLYRRHRGQAVARSRSSALAMLGRVGFADPERVMSSYPHELSGGMCQRVGIAMAMACEPRVLIADEPSSALDVTTQAQVLTQLLRLGREQGTAILLITHDLGVVAQYCERAVVMRDGQILETTSVRSLFAQPGHEYTQSLLRLARGSDSR